LIHCFYEKAIDCSRGWFFDSKEKKCFAGGTVHSAAPLKIKDNENYTSLWTPQSPAAGCYCYIILLRQNTVLSNIFLFESTTFFGRGCT